MLIWFVCINVILGRWLKWLQFKIFILFLYHQYVPEKLLPIYKNKVVPLAEILTPNQFEAEWVHFKNLLKKRRNWSRFKASHTFLSVLVSFRLLTGKKISTEDDAVKVTSINICWVFIRSWHLRVQSLVLFSRWWTCFMKWVQRRWSSQAQTCHLNVGISFWWPWGAK